MASKRAATSSCCASWARAVIDSRVPGASPAESSEKLHEGRADQPRDDRRVVDPLPVDIEDERRDGTEEVPPEANGKPFGERKIRGKSQTGRGEGERLAGRRSDVHRLR